MKLKRRHSWRVRPDEAVARQKKVLNLFRGDEAFSLDQVRVVAGLDVSYSRITDHCYAAVVLMEIDGLEVIEQSVAIRRSTFPYVPGLLSYREAPSLIAAISRLRRRPDVLLFDAQGRAHPRRMGLATHLGILYDTVSVGCAKSRLCGVHQPVGTIRGAWVELRDEKNDEVIGSVLRTRAGVRPVYVSVGHGCAETFARELVLRCAPKYRLPEPVRAAHVLSNQTRREHLRKTRGDQERREF